MYIDTHTKKLMEESIYKHHDITEKELISQIIAEGNAGVLDKY